MIKLVELNYHCHTEYDDPQQVIAKHRLSSGFIHFIKQRVKLIQVKHLNYTGNAVIEGIPYHFFKSRNKFWYIPFKTHRFIKKEKPDVVLVQGFVFVLQVIFLRRALGRRCVIIAQHHGEKPFNGIKGFLQQKADAAIDGYLFTSAGNADDWISKKIISNKEKCFEVLSASSGFIKNDRTICKNKLEITGVHNFLWVARLNANKDPLTVLTAFEQYLAINQEARMYMVYQTEELLGAIQVMINKSPLLQKAVHMIGKVEHEQLDNWFNACEFYISGSHSEGSGYALAEAMSCGCIPVVTAIPSFKKITGNGEYGILFEPGNAGDLYKKLCATEKIDKEQLSRSIHEYSIRSLSYKAIADQLYNVAVSLIAK
jgi:glycosyltransferase involved in cell wall biosynthesis